MKKIALTLLAVLILGTFVACNGEVDSLLWEEGEKSLKLKIREGSGYSFSPVSTVTEKSFTVPGSVRTWQDLVNMGFSISYYSYGYAHAIETQCIDNEGFVSFTDLLLNSDTGGVEIQEAIDFNTTYLLSEQPA